MKGKNVFIVLLLCVLCAAGGVYVGVNYLNNNEVEEEEKETKKEKKESKDKKEDKDKEDPNEVLSKILGDWGRCDKEMSCYGMYFQNETGKYEYLSYAMWSEAGLFSPINKVKKIGNNKYMLYIHIDAYEDETVTIYEQDVELEIDISKLDSNILIVNGKEYKKIVGDSETFYLNYFK